LLYASAPYALCDVQRPIPGSKLDLCAAPPLLCFLMAGERSFSMHFFATLLVALLGVLPASAQVAPTVGELRAYRGLHAAAARGDVADIEARIAAAENKEALDARHRTPLHVAVYQKQHDAARALIRLGADPNKLDIDRYDIITIAAVANDVPMLKVALEGGGNPKAVTSVYDGTALIAAAHLGHAEIVRTLIAAHAPLDHVNNLQWTALIESIVLGDGGNNHTETLRALVEAGANVNIPDSGGATPLKLARSRGYHDMVAILEKSGAK
jgi:ankyrin repeat protein